MFRSGILSAGGLQSPLRPNRKAARRRSAAAVFAAERLEERRLLSAYYSNGSSLLAGDGSAATPWNSLYAISIYTGFQRGDVVYLSGTFNNQNMFLEAPATGIGDRFSCPKCRCAIEVKERSTFAPGRLRDFTCQCGNQMGRE